VISKNRRRVTYKRPSPPLTSRPLPPQSRNPNSLVTIKSVNLECAVPRLTSQKKKARSRSTAQKDQMRKTQQIKTTRRARMKSPSARPDKEDPEKRSLRKLLRTRKKNPRTKSQPLTS